MDRKCRGIDQAGCPTLSRAGWRQRGGLWFPLVAAQGGGGVGGGYSGGAAEGVKAGHCWLAVPSAPHLKDGTRTVTRTAE